jgi:integrase
VGALLGDGGVDCTALAFTALCAVRSNEGRGARWSEIDIDAAAWTLPASRMKAGREHRVPLSVPALDILARIERKGSLVFNSTHHGKQISDTQFGRIMEKYAPGMKPHGLRSSFADWARENGYPADIIEHCLAHQVGTATSRSYARSDLLEQRRELMEAYGKFATGSRL